MSRSKKLCALLGVLGAVCLAALGAIHFEEYREQIKDSGEVILSLDCDAVTALSWEYEDTSLSFQKEDGWKYTQDAAFPVDEGKLLSLLKNFQSLSSSLTIEDPEDLSPYGLDQPVCTITVQDESQTHQISLGDYSSLDAKRYLSIGDGNVYLVENDPLDAFSIGLQGLADNDEVPLFDEITSLRFSGEENYQIDYQPDSTDSYSAEDVYFTRQDGKNLPVDSEKIEDYLWAVQDLQLTDYVSYKASEEDLKNCGLDDPELTVTIDYRTEDAGGEETSDRFILHISRDPKETDSGDEDAVTAYARVGDSPLLYKISSDSYRELAAVSYDTLRHAKLFWGDFDQVQQIDVELDGSSYTISSKQAKDERKYFYAGTEVSVEEVQNKLDALYAEAFTEEAPAKQKELGLTLHLDSETNPKVQIDLYRYDGTHCLAAIDGTPTALVSRSNAVALIEAIHAIVLN